MDIRNFRLSATLSNLEHYAVLLGPKDHIEVGHRGEERVDGPAWIVVSAWALTEKTMHTAKFLGGYVRYKSNNPDVKGAETPHTWNSKWTRMFHCRGKLYESLPEFDPSGNNIGKMWKLSTPGGFTPIVPCGYVAIPAAWASDTSWVILLKSDKRIIWGRWATPISVDSRETNPYVDASKSRNGGGYHQPQIEILLSSKQRILINDESCGEFGRRIWVGMGGDCLDTIASIDEVGGGETVHLHSSLNWVADLIEEVTGYDIRY